MNLLLFFILILIGIWIIWSCRDDLVKFYKNGSISRTRIYELYRVNDKTFLKWLTKLMPSYVKTWKNRNALTVVDLLLILLFLGSPSQATMNLAAFNEELRKDQEVPVADYRYLKQKTIFSQLPPVLSGMKTFPPSVSTSLLEVMKGEIEIESITILTF